MYVYILKSQLNTQKYYIGMTDDLKSRLKKHNTGQVSHTTKFKPWEFKNAIWFSDKKKALKFEKYLKGGSGRAFSKRHF